MRQFKYVTITLLMQLACLQSARATWSVVVIDAATGTIGIAGASCSPNCYGIGHIVPGVGAIVVQAMSNNDARARGVEMIVANATPAEIIAALRDPLFDPEKQQYAVLTLRHLVPSTYTGTETHTLRGALTAPGVSVQGNTLTTDSVLRKVMEAVMTGQRQHLSFEDVLMKALEAGSDAGGDKRCGEQRATSAFITIYKKERNSKPYLNLNTFGQQKGGHNAVHLLRKRYDRWKEKHDSE